MVMAEGTRRDVYPLETKHQSACGSELPSSDKYTDGTFLFTEKPKKCKYRCSDKGEQCTITGNRKRHTPTTCLKSSVTGRQQGLLTLVQLIIMLGLASAVGYAIIRTRELENRILDLEDSVKHKTDSNPSRPIITSEFAQFKDLISQEIQKVSTLIFLSLQNLHFYIEKNIVQT